MNCKLGNLASAVIVATVPNSTPAMADTPLREKEGPRVMMPGMVSPGRPLLKRASGPVSYEPWM